MPSRNGVKVPSNPGKAPTVAPKEGYTCPRCGRHHKKAMGKFPKLQSPLYAANDGYCPICRHCFIEMLSHYVDVLGDEKEAVRRMCLKFDIYWSEDIWAMMLKTNATNSRILAYISKANLVAFAGKTYDDTLDEEMEERRKAEQALVISELREISEDGETDTTKGVKPEDIPQSVVDYWGSSLPPEMYLELERRREYWSSKWNTSDLEPGAEALLRQVIITEVTINRDLADGKSVEKQTSSLNNLIGSLNLKPIQKKYGADNSALTEKPLGVVWQMIEEEEPIPEPDEEFKDVDGIRRYIMIWFFGCLCNMLGIDNKYSRLYDDELKRLKVERPEYEGEEDDAIIEDIFERAERREEERRKALEIEGEGEADETDSS